MAESRTWTAALVVIGDEILSGRTQDKNVAQLATWLNDQGIRLAEVRIIPDDTARIVETVNALRAEHDYLFTTGGIGPTHDDITSECIAAAFGVPWEPHPVVWPRMEASYKPGEFNTARQLRRAFVDSRIVKAEQGKLVARGQLRLANQPLRAQPASRGTTGGASVRSNAAENR